MSEPDKYMTLDDTIDAKLLASRRLLFSDQLDNETGREVIRRLWYLELTNPGKPILFIINSPGGVVDAGLAIWDQVNMITSPVTTLITGLAASMGSILSLCAGKGKRFATPHSRIMIHQAAIHGVIQGQATDIEIQTKEMLKTHNLLIDIYVEATGKDRAVIEQALDRDTWMTPQEAQEFGLLDRIITHGHELEWD